MIQMALQKIENLLPDIATALAVEIADVNKLIGKYNAKNDLLLLQKIDKALARIEINLQDHNYHNQPGIDRTRQSIELARYDANQAAPNGVDHALLQAHAKKVKGTPSLPSMEAWEAQTSQKGSSGTDIPHPEEFKALDKALERANQEKEKFLRSQKTAKDYKNYHQALEQVNQQAMAVITNPEVRYFHDQLWDLVKNNSAIMSTLADDAVDVQKYYQDKKVMNNLYGKFWTHPIEELYAEGQKRNKPFENLLTKTTSNNLSSENELNNKNNHRREIFNEEEYASSNLGAANDPLILLKPKGKDEFAVVVRVLKAERNFAAERLLHKKGGSEYLSNVYHTVPAPDPYPSPDAKPLYFYLEISQFFPKGQDSTKNKPFNIAHEKSISHLAQMTDMLLVFRQSGVVFTDLKPGNILVGENGTIDQGCVSSRL